jgi:hypothetical protein
MQALTDESLNQTPVDIQHTFVALNALQLLSQPQFTALLSSINEHEIGTTYHNWEDRPEPKEDSILATCQMTTQRLIVDGFIPPSKSTMNKIEAILTYWAELQTGAVQLGAPAGRQGRMTTKIDELNQDNQKRRRTKQDARDKKTLTHYTHTGPPFDGTIKQSHNYRKLASREFDMRAIGFMLKVKATVGKPLITATSNETLWALAFLATCCENGQVETVTNNARRAEAGTVSFIDIYQQITLTSINLGESERREQREHRDYLIDKLKIIKVGANETGRSLQSRIDVLAAEIGELGGEFDDTSKIQCIKQAVKENSDFNTATNYLSTVANTLNYQAIAEAIHQAGMSATTTKNEVDEKRVQFQEMKRYWNRQENPNNNNYNNQNKRGRETEESGEAIKEGKLFTYNYPKRYPTDRELADKVLALPIAVQNAIKTEIEAYPAQCKQYYAKVVKLWKDKVDEGKEKKGRTAPWMANK